jgi:hypothetical protein
MIFTKILLSPNFIKENAVL